MANTCGSYRGCRDTGDEVASTALQSHNNKNWKQICQEKELRGLSPNFLIHLSVSDLQYSQDRSAYSAAGKYVDRRFREYINRS
jgi:hypothetical protein